PVGGRARGAADILGTAGSARPRRPDRADEGWPDRGADRAQGFRSRGDHDDPDRQGGGLMGDTIKGRPGLGLGRLLAIREAPIAAFLVVLVAILAIGVDGFWSMGTFDN